MEKHQFLLLLGKFEEIRCGIIDVKTAVEENTKAIKEMGEDTESRSIAEHLDKFA